MGLGGFASFFELFVVFNFVYYGSEEFRFTLSQTIHRGEKHLKDILNSSDSIYKLLISDETEGKQVGETIELFVEKDTDDVIKELKNSKTLFEISKNEIINRFNKKCIIKGFSKYCLLAALFSLSILILTGIIPSIQQNKLFLVYDYLLITNLIVIVCLVGALLNDTLDELKVENIFNFHILIAFLVVIIGGCISFYFELSFFSDSQALNTNKNIAIWLSIISVSFHFVFYLVRYFFVYNNNKKEAYKLNERVKREVNEIDPNLITASEIIKIVKGTIIETKESS